MTTQQTLLQTIHAPLRRLDSDLKQDPSIKANFHIPGFRCADVRIMQHKHAGTEGIQKGRSVCNGAAQRMAQAPLVTVSLLCVTSDSVLLTG